MLDAIGQALVAQDAGTHEIEVFGRLTSTRRMISLGH